MGLNFRLFMKLKFFLVCFLAFVTVANSQIVVEKLKPSNPALNLKGHSLFFTNRPMTISKSGDTTFVNKYSKTTGKLYFGWYDYNNKKISLSHNATFEGKEGFFPEKDIRDENVFYDIYREIKEKKGISHLVFIVPGFGKSFKGQTRVFMQDVQRKYADSLNNNVAFATFAWGTENNLILYYKGQKVTKNAVADFAIFQTMLEDFMSDSTFFETHSRDFKVHLLSTSMGNAMIQTYLEKRQFNKIPFQQVYESIFLFGADVRHSSFNEGEGFSYIDQMAKKTFIVVNKKDVLLWFSGILNLHPRLGKKGPKKGTELAENVQVVDFTKHETIKDLSTLGHDYLFSNPWMKSELFNYFYRYSDVKQPD